MKNCFLIVLGLCLTGCATTEPPSELLGAYQLDDGRTVSIRRSVDSTLRYRVFEDGSSGRLYYHADNEYVSGPGFANRSPVDLKVRFLISDSGVTNTLEWEKSNDTTRTAQRIGTEREVVFTSHDVEFYGRLQLPDGPPPYPAVVLLHGSGDSVATEWFYNGDFFVANGIAAFTYDKRGTGRSDGAFTFDFELLADDASAAVERIAELAEIDKDNIGLSGYSQGAWTAPLAASKNDTVKFVIVNYGLIESPAEEARLEMRQILVDAGVSDDDLHDADELIRAAIEIVANDFKNGWDEFEPLKQKYADAEWMTHLKGTPVGKLTGWPKFLIKVVGPRYQPDGLPWHYDSDALLQKNEMPMAWLLGGRDLSAPNAQTITKLRRLIENGKPLELVLFPDADHGMLLFDEQEGERTYTRYAPDYFRTEVAVARKFTNLTK
jgi:dienelactone hydrolase